jgi:hypothetical protein
LKVEQKIGLDFKVVKKNLQKKIPTIVVEGPLSFIFYFSLIHSFSSASIKANNKECHYLQALKTPNSRTFVIHHELGNGGEQDATPLIGVTNVITQPGIKRKVGRAHLSLSFCGVGSYYNNYCCSLRKVGVARKRTPYHGFVGGWQHLQQKRRRRRGTKKGRGWARTWSSALPSPFVFKFLESARFNKVWKLGSKTCVIQGGLK